MTALQMTMKGLIVSVAGTVLLNFATTATPAYAGFEWTPPPVEAKPAPETGAAPATPVATPELPGPLTPEPDAAVPVAPVENAPLQSSDMATPAPVAEAGMKTLTVPSAQEKPSQVNAIAPPTASAPSEEITWQDKPVAAPPIAPAPQAQPAPEPAKLDMTPVQGFGKDIPLAIALRQVAPPQYAYRFDQGVSAGQKVSWQGGKPWPQVLSDMLGSAGLQVVIVGNVITVQRSGTNAESAPSAPEEKTVAAVAPSEPELAPAVPAKEPEEVEKAVSSSDEANDLPLPRTAYVPGSASAPPPQADAAPLDIQTEAQAAEATELAAVDEPVAAVALASGKPAPVVDIQNTHKWEAKPGTTLRETLEKWSTSAGAEMEWMSPYDYPVEHSFVFDGKFNDAVDSLLALYSRETPRPRGRLYPNLPTGPSVLMIN